MKSFMSKCRALGATTAVLSLALAANAQTIPPCNTGGTGGAIPASGSGGAGAPLPATPMVGTLLAAVPSGATNVTAVTLNGLTHTWVGDVQFVLQDPAGNKYNLFYRFGGFSCDFNGNYTIIGSCSGGLGAPGSCSGTAVLAPGTYAQSFGTFVSGTGGVTNTPLYSIPAAAGTWTLYAYDWAGGDTGNLTSWDLCFGTPPPPTGAPIAAPTLSSPATGATLAPPVTLSWTAVDCASWYEVDIDGTLYTPIPTTSTTAGAGPGTHTWKARAANSLGTGPFSATRTYTELGPPPASTCATGDTVGGLIPTSGTGGTGSTWPGTAPASALATTAAVTTPAGATKIVRVLLHGLNHTWVGDLQIVLTDPAGTQHTILHRAGSTAGSVGCGEDLTTGDYSFYETYGPAIEFGCPASTGPGAYVQSFGDWPTGTNGINNTALGSIPVPSGTNNWTVTIYDWAAGDTGSITGWDLCFDAPSGPVSYCTAGTTTNGCLATVTANANPSVSMANACNITVSNVEGQKNGILFYGLASNSAPWAAGSNSFLCVKPPTQRTGTQASGGTSGACDGTLVLNWNAYQAANPGSLGNPWSIGDKVYVQAWFRDPPAPKTTNLSDGLEMTYVP